MKDSDDKYDDTYRHFLFRVPKDKYSSVAKSIAAIDSGRQLRKYKEYRQFNTFS